MKGREVSEITKGRQLEPRAPVSQGTSHVYVSACGCMCHACLLTCENTMVHTMNVGVLVWGEGQLSHVCRDLSCVSLGYNLGKSCPTPPSASSLAAMLKPRASSKPCRYSPNLGIPVICPLPLKLAHRKGQSAFHFFTLGLRYACDLVHTSPARQDPVPKPAFPSSLPPAPSSSCCQPRPGRE